MPGIAAGASPTPQHGGWWRPMGAASHRPHARSLRPNATKATGPNPVPTHSKKVAIENLLFEKLLIFSPLLSSSKSVVGVKATARLFVASVSKQKPSAHFIAMAVMVVPSAYIPDHLLRHQVLSIPKETGDQLHRSHVTI